MPVENDGDDTTNNNNDNNDDHDDGRTLRFNTANNEACHWARS
jgi:hypothetical protein